MEVRRGRTALSAILILMTILISSGCSDDKNTWVVKDQSDLVKPRPGIARNVKAYFNLRGFDWIDDEHFLAYKQSAEAFGTDRGLAVIRASDGQVSTYIPTQWPARRALMAPDKTRLVYSVAGEGQSFGRLVHKDLKTGEEKAYTYDAWRFETQGQWLEGENLLLPQEAAFGDRFEDRSPFQYWRMDEAGDVKAFALDPPKSLSHPEQIHLFKCFEDNNMIYSVIGGVPFKGMCSYDKSSGVHQLYTEKDVVDAGKRPGGLGLYLVQGSKDYGDKTLSIINDKNEKTVVVAHGNVEHIAWSPKGTALLYSRYTPQNGTEIYVVDLKNPSSHLVMTYGSERVEGIFMSPDEKKILVRLGPSPVTQILSIR